MSLNTPAGSEEVTVSQTANCDHIPVIDLSWLISPDAEERQKLAALINDACTKVGFFYIKVNIRFLAALTISNAYKDIFA